MAAFLHLNGPAMPRLPSLLSRFAAIAACAGCAMAVAGEAPPAAPSTALAAHIAAALIAERAREQAMAGAGAIAAQLDTLARALSSGQVTLGDAALVMHIAMAGALPPPRGQLASAPRVSPEQVVAILDGTAAAPAPAAGPAASATPANPAFAAAPASGATANPPPIPSGSPSGLPVASVLAVGRGGDGKTSLVMVSAGADKHLAKGQHLLVMRSEKLIAQLGVNDLRDTMAVCVILSTPGSAEQEIREGDAVFLSGD
jgi:hypothetical protein